MVVRWVSEGRHLDNTVHNSVPGFQFLIQISFTNLGEELSNIFTCYGSTDVLSAKTTGQELKNLNNMKRIAVLQYNGFHQSQKKTESKNKLKFTKSYFKKKSALLSDGMRSMCARYLLFIINHMGFFYNRSGLPELHESTWI